MVCLELGEANDAVTTEALDEGILVFDGVVVKAIPAEFGSLPDFHVGAGVELLATVDAVVSEEGEND